MRLNKSAFSPPQAHKGQEDAATHTAKPESTNIASTSKDKSIAHPETRTSSNEASHRHYQGEASSSKDLCPRTQRSSRDCQTIRVTKKLARGVAP